MKVNYRNLLLQGNEWIDGTDKYGLILTDDIDSLLSCAILESVKNWNIEQIFLFKADGTYDYLGRTENATHEAIGVDFARKKHYMNMCKYKTYDEYNRTVWQVGFSTNNKTKSIAVNDAREWFEKGLIAIKSNNLLEEMKTFVAQDNGAFNAVTGSHDDLISGLWLCIQGIKQGFWYPF